MKLHKKLEEEVLKVYDIWLYSYLNGDVETYNLYLHDDYRFIGSTVNEDFLDKNETTKFFAETADQLAGKSDIRNSIRTIESFDELVFITDLFDAYFLNENDWAYYGKFRFTSALKKNKEGWRFIYQHFSTPDTKAQEGETWGTEQIAAENLQLREAIQRRTVELEQKNQELEIETALERVRARTMAMQKSDELREVVRVIYEQLDYLNFEATACNIIIMDEQSGDMQYWVSGFTQDIYPESYHVPNLDHPYLKAQIDTWKKDDYAVFEYSGKEKVGFDKLFFSQTEFKKVPEQAKQHMKSLKMVKLSTAYFNYGALQVLGPEAITEENASMLMRMAKVFDQTYTRFLDLQKAEAQAREGQIQLALEKVRMVALGLNKSEEMLKVAKALYEQLLKLGFSNIRNAIIDINNGEDDTFTDYDYSHEMSGTITQMSYHDDPTLEGQFQKMSSTINDFFELALEGKELEDLIAMRIKNGEDEDPRLLNTEILTYNLYSFGNGAIGISNFGLLNEEEKSILNRFSNVFTFAYKRYIDLASAEAQAKEAQIELSLERIRAKVTSMSESSDLLDIVVTMRTEFVSLGHEAHYFWYMRWLPEMYEKAMTSGDGSKIGMIMTLPRHIHGDIKLIADWEKSNEPSVVFAMDVETAVDYIHKMITLGDFVQVDPNAPTLDDIRHIGGLTFIMARTKHGEIGFSLPGEVPDPPKEDLDTLVRFAGVFDLAYRRFEDLKNAERRNRETQIELALERVRSKTMAMHNSNDVGATVVTLFDEVLKLGIDISIRCGIGILDKGTDYMETRSATSAPNSEVDFKMGMLDMTIHPMLIGLKKAWINGETSYRYDYTNRDVKKYYKALNNEPKYPFQIDLDTLPDKEFHNSFFFSEGILFAFTSNPMSEDAATVLTKFAGVFGQTYRRYLDLQKAEEQAQEALKQASLDRVRGQIASMRSTSDLQHITPLIWSELEILEVPFNRCGVFILDEIKANVQVYLTTPDGKPLGALNLPFDANELTGNMIEYWRKKKVYTQHWNREDFIKWMQSMISIGQIQTRKEYQGDAKPPESLDLHFIPFMQGMLYVGNSKPLLLEKIELVKTLAEVFSIAYARYEDFIHLEEAKNQIENTLTELKSTQGQLIHAEKMASLGELTAGIAHEIQNPLNFVTNFSEVNTELITELKEEIENGNLEEVKAIAEDIAGNEEKINHHGKRADGIVKGMLQHSRSSSDEKEPTDINILAEEFLRLSYHGLRAKDKSFNAEFKTEFDEDLPKINIIPQDIGRVLLNLFNNAFYACAERSRSTVNKNSGQVIERYKPTVTISTKLIGNNVEIKVSDNGNGIPPEVKEKIFQPFFTTKPTGEGTGLGLSLSYDIITKGHNGELTVNTKEGEGTEFIIIIPEK